MIISRTTRPASSLDQLSPRPTIPPRLLTLRMDSRPLLNPNLSIAQNFRDNNFRFDRILNKKKNKQEHQNNAEQKDNADVDDLDIFGFYEHGFYFLAELCVRAALGDDED